MGYHRAGFDVVGVDIRPQPRYPFEFHQGDAMTWPLDGFDAVHASPPCQRWSPTGTGRAIGDGHPDLLSPTRERLEANSLPYVIENIPTAPMPTSIVLCGITFGLPVIRHRRFEVRPAVILAPSLCPQGSYARSVPHGLRSGAKPYATGSWERAWREHVIPVVWPWMTVHEAGQAIPPAYTEWIGAHLLGALGVATDGPR